MDWSEEEKRKINAAFDKAIDGGSIDSAAVAAGTCAVELAAARGGTMTADELRRAVAVVGVGHEPTRVKVAEHISALGARNAVLEGQLSTAQHEAAQMDAALRVMVPDIEARMSSTCVWCGTPAPTPVTTDAIRAHVSEHVKVCREHPMRALEERLAAAEEGNQELVRRAQQAEGAIGRERAATAMWRKRVQDACDLISVSDGDLGAFDIVNRVKRLKDMLAEAELARDVVEKVDTGIIERLEARCATLSTAGQVLSSHMDKESDAEWPSPCPLCSGTGWTNSVDKWPNPTTSKRVCCWCREDGAGTPARHPCSPTCTHDDAATPGHSERVKERSASLAHVFCEHDVSKDADAFCAGAEAMRAACWEAVRLELVKFGITRDEPMYVGMKSAIEGVVP